MHDGQRRWLTVVGGHNTQWDTGWDKALTVSSSTALTGILSLPSRHKTLRGRMSTSNTHHWTQALALLPDVSSTWVHGAIGRR